jgi:thiamine transport system permease protein
VSSRLPILTTTALAVAALAGIMPVLATGSGSLGFDAYTIGVVRFTVFQAGLSTVLSLALGVPLALTLFRAEVPGRRWLIYLLSVPLVLPAITVVLGLVHVYGARGWLSGWLPLYGMTGVLLAHVFFNAPLTARLCLTTLDTVPLENRRLAAQLGMTETDELKRVLWPALRASLPGIAILVFMLCAASFTVILILGGGPQATTLEVAIYQALRADFDPSRAASLALLQMAFVTALLLIAYALGDTTAQQPVLARRSSQRRAVMTPAEWIVILIALSLVLPPIAALLMSGLSNIHLSPDLVRATLTSLCLAGLTATLACMTSFILATWATRSSKGRKLAPAAILIAMALPPAVLATGWFILVTRANLSIDIMLVIALNTLACLPFCYRGLEPATARHVLATDRLCASLGVSGFNRLRLVDAPALRRPIAAAAALAAIVAIGDLTAILLLGNGGYVTLPTLIYQQMGSYRSEEASGTALVLAIIAVGLLILADRWRVQDD